MRIEDIRGANRKVSAALVEELGYSAHDVMDRGDGKIDVEGSTLVLAIVQRDADGRALYDGSGAITRKERVSISPERLAAYEEALTP